MNRKNGSGGEEMGNGEIVSDEGNGMNLVKLKSIWSEEER